MGQIEIGATLPQMQELRFPLPPEVLTRIKRIGLSPAPVLITGETGTGKEVVARAIYESGPKRGAFVPIDCGSLVGTLIESELFGHRKGSFTDAKADRVGLIGEAANGTAFFDEIGDLPLEMQVKLLRVIQEGEYRPIGAPKPIPVQFRVMAATWRNLESMIEEGKFRKDLFYRLNVLDIHLKPLRERKDEILELVQIMLSRYGADAQNFTAEALREIHGYEWPGNIRELGNMVQRILALGPETTIRLGDLPESMRSSTQIAPQTDMDQPIVTLAEQEKQYILNALARTSGDRGKTATILGIDRTTLFRKLKGYGVE